MLGPSRILPFLIIIAVLAFSVRLTEVVTGISNLSATAHAESPKKDKKNKESAEEMAANAKGHMSKDSAVEVVDEKDVNAPKWRDANDSNFDVSNVKMEMFEDLSIRREQLEKNERDLQVREALLQATAKELDRKYQELTKLRKEIEGLLNQQSKEEQGRIDSLVKIYEGMKPKDAARIFDTLDIDVLVAVISKMSERKIAPVMAAMNPERARSITIMLAEQKQLPSL